MFYIIERLRGCQGEIQGLKFAEDDVNEYFVCGCTTSVEMVSDGYYSAKKSDKWNHRGRKYDVDVFIKQIQRISKRERDLGI